MKTHALSIVTLAYSLVLSASPVHAAMLYTLSGATQEFASPGVFDAVLDSTGGLGLVTFRIDGFKTLDGFNAGADDQDTFTLSLNGAAIFSGTWDLGGGGGNVILFGDPAATAVGPPSAFGQGGRVDIATPLTLVAGVNVLHFAYDSHKPLGLGDEGWDLRNIAVTGPGVDVEPVTLPEPASWALMLTGFFGLGGLLRRRRGSARI